MESTLAVEKALIMLIQLIFERAGKRPVLHRQEVGSRESSLMPLSYSCHLQSP